MFVKFEDAGKDYEQERENGMEKCSTATANTCTYYEYYWSKASHFSAL